MCGCAEAVCFAVVLFLFVCNRVWTFHVQFIGSCSSVIIGKLRLIYSTVPGTYAVVAFFLLLETDFYRPSPERTTEQRYVRSTGEQARPLVP